MAQTIGTVFFYRLQKVFQYVPVIYRCVAVALSVFNLSMTAAAWQSTSVKCLHICCAVHIPDMSSAPGAAGVAGAAAAAVASPPVGSGGSMKGSTVPIAA